MVSAARKIYIPCVVGFYIFKPKSLMLLTEVCLRKLSNFSVRRSCPSLVLLNIIHQLHRATMTMTLIWLHCSLEPKFWRDEVNLTLIRCWKDRSILELESSFISDSPRTPSPKAGSAWQVFFTFIGYLAQFSQFLAYGSAMWGWTRGLKTKIEGSAVVFRSHSLTLLAHSFTFIKMGLSIHLTYVVAIFFFWCRARRLKPPLLETMYHYNPNHPTRSQSWCVILLFPFLYLDYSSLSTGPCYSSCMKWARK